MTRPCRKPAVDWSAAEEILLAEVTVRFPEIAAEHPDEEFYGVFFDCDVVYTGALAHLNSETRLRKKAEQCQWSGTGGPIYPELTVEQVMEELRWSGGDWG